MSVTLLSLLAYQPIEGVFHNPHSFNSEALQQLSVTLLEVSAYSSMRGVFVRPRLFTRRLPGRVSRFRGTSRTSQ